MARIYWRVAPPGAPVFLDESERHPAGSQRVHHSGAQVLVVDRHENGESGHVSRIRDICAILPFGPALLHQPSGAQEGPGRRGDPPPQEPGSRHDAPDHAARLQALDEEADEI